MPDNPHALEKMQNSEQKKKLLTTGDIAAHCEVSYETVANWIKGGKLKSHQTPGGHRRIRMEDFIDFLSVHDMPPLNAPADPNQRRILVVDDEPGILKLITRSFERKKMPHALRTAGDGFEAGLQVVKFRPDLIILDLMMPNLDGFRVCQLVRANPQTRHIGILVITGSAAEANVKRAMDSGADRWMAKPFDPGELLEQVDAILAICDVRAKKFNQRN